MYFIAVCYIQYTYYPIHHFSIQSSIGGPIYPIICHIWATISNVAVNTGMTTSFQISVLDFFKLTPRSGIISIYF